MHEGSYMIYSHLSGKQITQGPMEIVSVKLLNAYHGHAIILFMIH
jgi:hypothetical protein